MSDPSSRASHLRSRSFTIPTASSDAEEARVELDLDSMTEESLKSLRKSDIFLYYSIPGKVKPNKDVAHCS